MSSEDTLEIPEDDAEESREIFGPVTGRSVMSRRIERQVENATYEQTGGSVHIGKQASGLILAGMGPRGMVDGMLCAQIVAVHEAVMESFRLAALPRQSLEGKETFLKQGAKLAGTCERLVAALNKHRGRGQQKVTVEHVHVNDGGQAIVGHVAGPTRTRHTEEAPQPAPQAASPAIEAPREEPMEIEMPRDHSADVYPECFDGIRTSDTRSGAGDD
jgi:hypothetical protein